MQITVKQAETIQVVKEPKMVVVEFTPAQALLVAGMLANVLPNVLEAAGFEGSPCFGLADAATGSPDAWTRVVAFENYGVEGSNPAAIKGGENLARIESLTKAHQEALNTQERARFLFGD